MLTASQKKVRLTDGEERVEERVDGVEQLRRVESEEPVDGGGSGNGNGRA